MFAVQVFERDPLGYKDIPPLIVTWIQDAGGFAAFAVGVWIVMVLTGFYPLDRRKVDRRQAWLFLFCASASVVCYVALCLARLPELFAALAEAGSAAYIPSAGMLNLQSLLLTLGGLFAIGAAGVEFLGTATRMSARRIGAIARLSFKEALRRRVPYAFALLLAIFLFGNWYVPYKPEDQVRTYVSLVYYAMGPLLLTSALVLGAFSIPNDIRQQTIHTILTKPVQRFEVVLGRFLGFTGLLSLILLVMTTLSLIYVLRNVDPAAAAESLMARVPAYGDLTFENTPETKKAESVGREWDYRSYIAGPLPGKLEQTAVWAYPALPASVANRPVVRCEFAFDVYRLDKGEENKGINCTFTFQTWRYRRENQKAYQTKRQELLANRQGKSDSDIDNILSEEFGYYQKAGKSLIDYQTQSLDLPGGLFRNALEGTPPATGPAIQVQVKNDSKSGYVGMARYDLYFRLDDPEGGWETLWFAWNFYKGAFGLWFSTVLVCGLSVALSTYLTGVIALLVTLQLYIGGMFQDFIRSVGEGTTYGGGPMEALWRLASRANLAAPLEDTTFTRVAASSDTAFRWLVRRLMDILPDVDRFSLASYVAEGFNIPASQLCISLLMLVGYLLPWGILAFYLIKWREVASQT